MKDEGPITEEPTTSLQCPHPGCELGVITTRQEDGTNYAVSSHSCSYCGGTGLVSPARYAAWARLVKDGKIPDPASD